MAEGRQGETAHQRFQGMTFAELFQLRPEVAQGDTRLSRVGHDAFQDPRPYVRGSPHPFNAQRACVKPVPILKLDSMPPDLKPRGWVGFSLH
eukprot:14284984-Alexandrium_andersonii.AAC.2